MRCNGRRMLRARCNFNPQSTWSRSHCHRGQSEISRATRAHAPAGAWIARTCAHLPTCKHGHIIIYVRHMNIVPNARGGDGIAAVMRALRLATIASQRCEGAASIPIHHNCTVTGLPLPMLHHSACVDSTRLHRN